MKILIVHNSNIPALKYGGTERVLWSLGKELSKAGHKVTFLVGKKSICPFAETLIYNPEADINTQIPEDTDLVHSFTPMSTTPKKPFLNTVGYNGQPFEEFDINTVFVSKDHAERHGSECFVYNGLSPEDYGKVNWLRPREHLIFMGQTSRKEKNVKDCKFIAMITEQNLVVMGGNGFSFSKYISYKGFVSEEKKNMLLNKGKALLYPVRWHEPFGMSILESMYFGCPVVGSPYGSLPELITQETGHLSDNLSDMIEALENIGSYNRKKIHQYVTENFTSTMMMENYMKLYEKVLNGETLNRQKPKSIITEQLPLLPIFD